MKMQTNRARWLMKSFHSLLIFSFVWQLKDSSTGLTAASKTSAGTSAGARQFYFIRAGPDIKFD